MNLPSTPGPWNSECVSDYCRVFVGQGRRKIILARLSPRQLPESESAANGRLMAAAPQLLAVARRAMALLSLLPDYNLSPTDQVWKDWDAVRMNLEGKK